MKKLILITSLIILSLTLRSQTLLRRGVIIGNGGNTFTVDSIIKSTTFFKLYNGATELLAIDTATMLTKYIQRSDTSLMLSKYIHRVDTSSMLTKYARKASPTFTGTVTLPSATSIGDVSSTEIEYVNNVTSNIQTQLNARGRVATITTNILAGEETDVTLTGVTAEPYSLYIIDADGLNITDAVKDSTAISGGVYHTYIYSVDAKTNAKIRVLW